MHGHSSALIFNKVSKLSPGKCAQTSIGPACLKWTSDRIYHIPISPYINCSVTISIINRPDKPYITGMTVYSMVIFIQRYLDSDNRTVKTCVFLAVY